MTSSYIYIPFITYNLYNFFIFCIKYYTLQCITYNTILFYIYLQYILTLNFFQIFSIYHLIIYIIMIYSIQPIRPLHILYMVIYYTLLYYILLQYILYNKYYNLNVQKTKPLFLSLNFSNLFSMSSDYLYHYDYITIVYKSTILSFYMSYHHVYV